MFLLFCKENQSINVRHYENCYITQLLCWWLNRLVQRPEILILRHEGMNVTRSKLEWLENKDAAVWGRAGRWSWWEVRGLQTFLLHLNFNGLMFQVILTHVQCQSHRWRNKMAIGWIFHWCLCLFHASSHSWNKQTTCEVSISTSTGKAQAAQTLNTIITILSVYKTMYENALKITLNAVCRK